MTGKTFQSLRAIGLFDALGVEGLADIEQYCTWLEFKAGSAIIDVADDDDSVCFLVAGQARELIYSAGGKSVVFREFEAGEWFGEYTALDGLGRPSGVEAVRDCVVVKLPADRFNHLVETDPDVNKALILHLVLQLQQLLLHAPH